MIGARTIGAAERALTLAVDWARERVQGRPVRHASRRHLGLRDKRADDGDYRDTVDLLVAAGAPPDRNRRRGSVHRHLASPAPARPASLSTPAA